MTWFSAESALMWMSASACGPIAIPTMRNSATSGILIFCASRPATVPIARIRPQESSVFLAILIEADASNCRLAFVQRPAPRSSSSIVDVDDPAGLGMEDHHAIVDDRIMVVGHTVALGNRIGFVGSGPQFPVDHDFILISIGRPVLAHHVFAKRLAVLVGDHGTGRDGGTADGSSYCACDRILLRKRRACRRHC